MALTVPTGICFGLAVAIGSYIGDYDLITPQSLLRSSVYGLLFFPAGTVAAVVFLHLLWQANCPEAASLGTIAECPLPRTRLGVGDALPARRGDPAPSVSRAPTAQPPHTHLHWAKQHAADSLVLEPRPRSADQSLPA